MLNPDVTDKDVGRRVIYTEPTDHPHRKIEVGIITSFSPAYVFVRYRGITSAATRREDLAWADADKSNTARPDAVL
jgi:hypothetical protein